MIRSLTLWLLLIVLPLQAWAAVARQDCSEVPRAQERFLALKGAALPHWAAIKPNHVTRTTHLEPVPSPHHHWSGGDGHQECCASFAMMAPPQHASLVVPIAQRLYSAYVEALAEAPLRRLERPPRLSPFA